jgi:hypothetical protein
MSREGTLANWLVKPPAEVMWSELEPHVADEGFTQWTVNHGRRIQHPDLKGSGRFPDGIIQINDHFKKEGQVHPKSLKDFISAVKYIRQQRKQNQSQQFQSLPNPLDPQ